MTKIIHLQLDARSTLFAIDIGLADRLGVQRRANHVDRSLVFISILDGQSMPLDEHHLTFQADFSHLDSLGKRAACEHQCEECYSDNVSTETHLSTSLSSRERRHLACTLPSETVLGNRAGKMPAL